MKRLSTPLGTVELVGQRTRYGKTFDGGNGKRIIQTCLRPVHLWSAGAWADIDSALIVRGPRDIGTLSTSYSLSIDPRRFTLTFTSESGVSITIRLVSLNGVAPALLPLAQVVVSGESVRLIDLVPDFDLEIRCRAESIEIYKTIKSALSPTRITWEFIHPVDLADVTFQPDSSQGRDNVTRGDVARRGTGFNQARRIELLHTRTPDDLLSNPGFVTYQMTEEVTGRTRWRDPVTRVAEWRSEFIYPVEIDTTVIVGVTAGVDDGYGAGGTWYATGTLLSLNSVNVNPGMRFLSVNVPQGQTLDSATLTVFVSSASGSFTSPLTLAGQAVDTAPLWAESSANDPDTMAATTATTPVSRLANGSQVVTVTTICQELVNRAGWVANNHIRLGFSDVSTMGTGYMFWDSYETAGANQPVLTIVYTAAGGAAKAHPALMAGPAAWCP